MWDMTHSQMNTTLRLFTSRQFRRIWGCCWTLIQLYWYTGHDSFIRVPWLIHTCTMTDSWAYKTISPRSGLLLDGANDCALFVTHHKCCVIHTKNVMYVYMHAFIHAWMHVCMYVWRDKQLRPVLYTPQILFMHAYMNACLDVCMYVCRHVNDDESYTMHTCMVYMDLCPIYINVYPVCVNVYHIAPIRNLQFNWFSSLIIQGIRIHLILLDSFVWCRCNTLQHTYHAAEASQLMRWKISVERESKRQRERERARERERGRDGAKERAKEREESELTREGARGSEKDEREREGEWRSERKSERAREW